MSTMVDAIVTSLVNNVSQLLVQETSLVLNARDEVKSLQSELKFIKEFLRHSEGNRDEVKEEVKQIQDVALEAEDILDNFVINMAQYTRRNWLGRLLHVGEKTIMLRNVSVQVQGINKMLQKIHANKDKYKVTSHGGNLSERDVIQSQRRNVEEDEVVSFDNYAEQVKKLLDTKDSRRDVVSIVGMGGLGKTTLAKKIFNGRFVQQSFDCRAWVDVSQDYNRKELLVKISKCVFLSTEMLEADKLTEEELVEKLRVGLESKRYMIVLDDVWDKHLWNTIKAAFPDNGKSSRILLTSRLNEVALLVSVPKKPYALPFLDEDDSWKLFSKKVFHEQVCPPFLEQLARQKILPKCKGLPLAIVVAAGLFRNREESMWSKVVDALNWYLAKNPTECLGVLALSYDDLPPQLKPCFLYFGIYPEDVDIPVRILIRHWVAEGFIDEESDRSLDMEDIAEEYLLQLIDRNLIQVARRRTDGGVKSCRIHDLLRDLSILEAKKEKFLMVDRNIDSSPLASSNPVIIKRLSIHCGSRELRYDYLSMPEFSRLRSLFAFGEYRYYHWIHLDRDPFRRLPKFCRYLRLLELGEVKYEKFLPEIEKLVQLRYLRMKCWSNLDKNFQTIAKLDNLQTLQFNGTGGYRQRTKFYANNWKMHQLRHLLIVSGTGMLIKFKGNISLPNLRTLSNLCLETEEEASMLQGLTNLKKLRVSCHNLSSPNIRIFEHLTKLQRLQTLNIRGNFRFTDTGTLPLSLTKITFTFTCLDSSDFQNLGRLPNLQVLKLGHNSFLSGSKLECHGDRGEFPRLRYLRFDCVDIESLSMEGRGLQSLVYLIIRKCSKLRVIPEQLKQLDTLREFTLTSCSALDKGNLKDFWGNDSRLKMDNFDKLHDLSSLFIT